MNDPIPWSFPLPGRPFGITVKIHLLFPIVAVGLIGRTAFQQGAVPGVWQDATWVMIVLFLSVLLHEFGHCAGARLMDGDAEEILIWPLGGLAYCDVPHNWRANLVTAVFGPLVNVVLCLILGLSLMLVTKFEVRPPINPLWPSILLNEPGKVLLYTWHGEERLISNFAEVLLARAFWVNWALLLLNVVLVGFPMDGGRILQCILWPIYDYRQATQIAIYVGFAVMLVVGLVSIMFNEVLALALALFIYVSCKQQYIILETGAEDAQFGYDFTHGYTSLEKETPPRRKRPNFFQRWLQKRAARRMQREQEQRESEEKRMDELLEKVQRSGMTSLTDEERRFLKRVSDRYRNRQ